MHANFPILSDMDNGYALLLNLAFYVGDEKRRFMTAAGWDVSPYQGNESWTLPIPATFVVGRDGRVTARFIDPDYRKRMEIDDILACGSDRARELKASPWLKRKTWSRHSRKSAAWRRRSVRGSKPSR